MTPSGFKPATPASEPPQTCFFDSAATAIVAIYYDGTVNTSTSRERQRVCPSTGFRATFFMDGKGYDLEGCDWPRTKTDIPFRLSANFEINLQACTETWNSGLLCTLLHVYLCTNLFACLSVCLSVCLPICLSVCLFACLSVCLSVCLCIYLSVYLSI